ncbi:MAG: phosphotransferase [Acidobacteria bacterium]|nr:phosphotransferase [Acidobacteriota bacterium]
MNTSSCSAGRTVWRSPWLMPEWVDRPLERYQQAFGITASEERLFTDVRKRARLLIGTPLPRVWLHWGLDERNILRGDQEISVIDWDGGEVGPPLFDLLYFMTRWSCAARGLKSEAAQLRGFRQLYFEPDSGGISVIAARQAIDRYLTKLELDRRFLPLLLVLMWVHRAVGRFDRQGALGQRGLNPRTGNQYVGYVGILAEHVEQLFALSTAESP